jgi:hypothetical protein
MANKFLQTTHLARFGYCGFDIGNCAPYFVGIHKECGYKRANACESKIRNDSPVNVGVTKVSLLCE